MSKKARDRYQSMLDCLKALRLGSYMDHGRITFLQAVRVFRKWILSVFLSSALMGGATELISGLNRRLAHSNGCLRDEVERRRRATEELQASNERFSAVLESLDALVYVADMETHELLFVNKYGRQAWGEVVGKVCWRVIQSGQTRPCAFCNNHRLLDSQGNPTGIRVWEFQNTVNNRWYECRDQAIRWTDGRIVRLEIAVDITERIRAKEELVYQNRFLKHVLESLTYPFLVINVEDFSVRTANSAAGVFWEGSTCYQLTHRSEKPCGGAEHPCVVDIIKRTGRPAVVEHIHYDRDGEPRNIEVHGYPIFNEEGVVEQVIEYALDVTDRKRAERELRENEEYLRTIMATIHTGVLISEADSGKIVDLNPSAAKLIGAEAAEIIGRPWSAYLKEAPEGDEIGQDGEADGDGQLKTARGERLSMRLSKAHASIRSRRYAIHSFTDISDIRELFRRQAVNTELAKGLLSLVSPGLTRHNRIDDRVTLHVDALSLPCLDAGGDHLFVRPLAGSGNGAGPATFLSIKDQSGHEVNCILRSIFTDLVHNALLQDRDIPAFDRTIEELNVRLIRGGMFAAEDFVTAMLARIDHDTLLMHYASCGHPPFLFIRGDRVVSLPRAGKPGGNLPLGTIEDIPFSAGRIRLRAGDKLLFYTDGLTEMPLQKRGWNLSSDRLTELVYGITRRKGCRRVSDLMRELLSAVADLSGQKVRYPDANSSADDVTLIGLEVEDITEASEKTLLPRDMDELCAQIRELSAQISDQWRVSGLVDAAGRVRIVLEEAVLNAWKHGHGGRPGRPITVRWREGNDFHLEVIDTGEGFDPNLAADPTQPQNRLNTSGRGLFMIRMYADETRWRNGGRHLTAGFYRYFRPFDAFQRKPYCNLIPMWETSSRERS